MPIDTEIWERACKRAEVRRRVDLTPEHLSDGTGIVSTFASDYPPLGSPDAVVKMLEWLTAEIEVLVEEDGESYRIPDHRARPELWFDEDLVWHARANSWCDIVSHKSLALAIAAAVCVLPEEK